MEAGSFFPLNISEGFICVGGLLNSRDSFLNTIEALLKKIFGTIETREKRI